MNELAIWAGAGSPGHELTTPAPPAGEEGPTASSPQDKVDDREASDALVRKILEVEARLARNEDEAVAASVAKGLLLAELKSRSRRTWGGRLRQLKINSRVARRLMAIGSRGLELGLIGSDLLAKLPQDVLKLEWIVKLEPGQLRPFVETLDCRSEPRAKVIRAVKEALGQLTPGDENEEFGPSLEAIEKLVKRLLDQIERIYAESSDASAKGRLDQILVAAMARMEEQAGTSRP